MLLIVVVALLTLRSKRQQTKTARGRLTASQPAQVPKPPDAGSPADRVTVAGPETGDTNYDNGSNEIASSGQAWQEREVRKGRTQGRQRVRHETTRSKESNCGNSMSWILRLLVGCTIALLLSGIPCRAQEDESEENRAQRFKLEYAQAGKAYAAGENSLQQPCATSCVLDSASSSLALNIAQAYRRLEQWSAARVYFELYRHVNLNMPKETSLSLDGFVAEAREKELAQHTPKVIEKTKLLYVSQEKPLPRWLRPFWGHNRTARTRSHRDWGRAARNQWSLHPRPDSSRAGV